MLHPAPVSMSVLSRSRERSGAHEVHPTDEFLHTVRRGVVRQGQELQWEDRVVAEEVEHRDDSNSQEEPSLCQNIPGLLVREDLEQDPGAEAGNQAHDQGSRRGCGRLGHAE